MKATLVLLLTFYISISPLLGQDNPERKQLLDTIFIKLEANVANPGWLKDESYVQLKDSLYADKAMEMPDDTFLSYFNKQVENLPFTHFYLRRIKRNKPAPKTSEKKQDEGPLMWKELNEKTAYLKIRSFSSDASSMVKAVEEIGTDRYDHLIIDLRGNSGGTLDAPVVLGRFLTQKPIDVGILMTRPWFEENDRQPTPEEIGRFPYLTDMTYVGISKMFAEEAAFRLVIPGHDQPVFKGKVFVLQDGITASANEPLLDAFKEEGIATLVGSKTSGAMLSAYYFPVNDDYKVFIPTADYQTARGNRIDKVGVSPDVETDPANALEYVLEVLIPSES